MYGYTYITENLINGKKYIGQHKGEFDPTYLGSGTILHHSIRKYGHENFKVTAIEYHVDKVSLDVHEKTLICEHNATKSNMYYNIAEGGNGGDTRAGMSPQQYDDYCRKLKQAQNSPELLKKRSVISKEVYNRPGVREKITKHSNEKWTQELKKKMSDSAKKAHNRPEVVELHRQRAFERSNDPEYIKTQRKNQLGRRWYHNPVTGEKMTIGPNDTNTQVPDGWRRGRGSGKNKTKIREAENGMDYR